MAAASGARTRILDAAYDLFSRRGIRGVGIDSVIAQSAVSRMTLYRHFRSPPSALSPGRGTRGVGIDSVIAAAPVAGLPLYRHFRSKEHLVLAYLECREERWTRAWLQDEVQRRASDPQERLLAIFDVF